MKLSMCSVLICLILAEFAGTAHAQFGLTWSQTSRAVVSGRGDGMPLTRRSMLVASKMPMTMGKLRSPSTSLSWRSGYQRCWSRSAPVCLARGSEKYFLHCFDKVNSE